MDVGLFRRSKSATAAWVLGPFIVIGLLHFSVSGYCRYVENSLEQDRYLMVVIPQLQQRLQQVDETMGLFARPSENLPEVAEKLTAYFNETAEKHNITVRSLSAEKNKPGDQSLNPLLTIAMKGEACLPELVKAFNDLQEQDSLFIVESAHIRVSSLDPEPRYDGDFVLQFHGIAPTSQILNRPLPSEQKLAALAVKKVERTAPAPEKVPEETGAPTKPTGPAETAAPMTIAAPVTPGPTPAPETQTEPAVMEPAAAKPAVTEPATSKPATSEPTGTPEIPGPSADTPVETVPPEDSATNDPVVEQAETPTVSAPDQPGTVTVPTADADEQKKKEKIQQLENELNKQEKALAQEVQSYREKTEDLTIRLKKSKKDHSEEIKNHETVNEALKRELNDVSKKTKELQETVEAKQAALKDSQLKLEEQSELNRKLREDLAQKEKNMKTEAVPTPGPDSEAAKKLQQAQQALEKQLKDSETLRTEIEAARQAESLLKKEAEKLRAELSATKDNLKVSTMDSKALGKQIEDLRRQMAERAQPREMTQGESAKVMAALKKELAGAQKEVAEEEERYTSLQQQLEEQTQAREAEETRITQERKDTQEKLKILQQRLDGELKHNREFSKVAERTQKDLLNNLATVKSALERTGTQLGTTKKALDEEIARTEALRELVKGFENRENPLKDQIQSLETRLKDQQKRNDELETVRSEYVLLKRNYDRDIKKVADKLESVSKQAEGYKTSADQVDASLKELQKNHHELQVASQQEIRTLKSEVGKIEKARTQAQSDLQAVQAKADELSALFEETKEERDELKGMLSSTVGDIVERERKATADLKVTREQLKLESERRAALEKENAQSAAQLTANVKSLSDRLQRSQSEIEALQKTAAEAEKRWQDKLAKSQAESAEHAAEAETLTADMKALKKEMQQIEPGYKVLTGKVNDLETTLAKETKEASDRITRLTQDLRTATEQAKTYQKQAGELTRRYDQLKAQSDAKLKDLTQNLDEVQVESDENAKVLAETQVRLNVSREQHLGLKKETAQKESELMKTIEDLRAELGGIAQELERTKQRLEKK